MKKILPHEIENFTKGTTTYKQAVKELGKPLASEPHRGGKHCQWTDRQIDGHNWLYRDIHAWFDKAGVLQNYSVHIRWVPQFGASFLR